MHLRKLSFSLLCFFVIGFTSVQAATIDPSIYFNGLKWSVPSSMELFPDTDTCAFTKEALRRSRMSQENAYGCEQLALDGERFYLRVFPADSTFISPVVGSNIDFSLYSTASFEGKSAYSVQSYLEYLDGILNKTIPLTEEALEKDIVRLVDFNARRDVFFPSLLNDDQGIATGVGFFTRSVSPQDFDRGSVSYTILLRLKDQQTIGILSWYIESSYINEELGYVSPLYTFFNEKGYALPAESSGDLSKFYPPKAVAAEFVQKYLITDKEVMKVVSDLQSLALHHTFASSFTDVGIGSAYTQAMMTLKDMNVVSGYADGAFHDQSTINRAEFIKILMGSVSTEEERSRCISSQLQKNWSYSYFSDVSLREWYAPYVCVAKERAIISGYGDGTFRPNNQITMVEALKIIFMGHNVQLVPAPNTPWYEAYVRTAEDKFNFGHDSASTVDKYSMPIERGYMAQMIYRVLLTQHYSR